MPIIFNIIYLIVNKIFKNYIINELGCEIVNEMKYSNIFLPFSFSFGVKYIKKNDKYGLIIGRKNMIEPQYDEIRFYKKYNDMLAVKKAGMWGFVRIADNWKRIIYEAIPPIYDAVDDFGVIRRLVILNGEKFYVNRKGERVI